jgi:hypothetical protein
MLRCEFSPPMPTSVLALCLRDLANTGYLKDIHERFVGTPATARSLISTSALLAGQVARLQRLPRNICRGPSASLARGPYRTTRYRRRSLSCELFESVIIRHLLTNAADCIFDGGAYQSRRLAFRDVGLVGKDADHDLVLAVDQ